MWIVIRNRFHFGTTMWDPGNGLTNSKNIINECGNHWFSIFKSSASNMDDVNFKPDLIKNLLPEDTWGECVDIRKENNTPQGPTYGTIKLKLKLTRDQKKTLSQWFGVNRVVYNACVDLFNAKYVRGENFGDVKFSVEALRSYFINSDSKLVQEKPWILQTPYEIRDCAIRDFMKALTIAFEQKARGTIKKYRMKFRSRLKSKQTSIVIREKCYKDGKPHPRYWKHEPMDGTESQLPTRLPSDSRMVRDNLGNYYLHIQYVRQSNSLEKKFRVVAFDPGVRTFLTGYDPAGEALEIGKNDMGKIIKLAYHLDDLISRTSKLKSRKKKRSYGKAIKRMRQRIRNLIHSFHHKVAKYLCEHFSLIILPKFNAKQMSMKCKRRISSKTVRKMLCWSHCKFRELLLSKAAAFEGVQVKIVGEAYTSKTCGRCGHLHRKLQGSKTFKCPNCHYLVDRDVNGARNILLRYLSFHRNNGVLQLRESSFYRKSSKKRKANPARQASSISKSSKSKTVNISDESPKISRKRKENPLSDGISSERALESFRKKCVTQTQTPECSSEVGVDPFCAGSPLRPELHLDVQDGCKPISLSIFSGRGSEKVEWVEWVEK